MRDDSRAERRVYVTGIERSSARAGMERMLDRLQIVRPGPPVSLVAVKVNLCDYRMAESGATTDPEILGGLLTALGARYPRARLVVVENDASAVEAWSLFRVLGIDRAAQRAGAEVFSVAAGAWVAREVTLGGRRRAVSVPEIVARADLVVNLAKMKTNSFTKMTGCLKNTFGLVREKHKAAYHRVIDETLALINLAVPADLCLIDGCIAMEGIGGPAFGRPRRCGLLVGGRNPVSVDACAARIMGFWPRWVSHIRYCERAGLGTRRFRLETDIEEFDLRAHRFQFDSVQYLVRKAIRGVVGVGA